MVRYKHNMYKNTVKIKQLWTQKSKEKIYIYIYIYIYMKGWLQYSKWGGMGLVIKKLTHPKSLTHKDFSV